MAHTRGSQPLASGPLSKCGRTTCEFHPPLAAHCFVATIGTGTGSAYVRLRIYYSPHSHSTVCWKAFVSVLPARC